MASCWPLSLSTLGPHQTSGYVVFPCSSTSSLPAPTLDSSAHSIQASASSTVLEKVAHGSLSKTMDIGSLILFDLFEALGQTDHTLPWIPSFLWPLRYCSLTQCSNCADCSSLAVPFSSFAGSSSCVQTLNIGVTRGVLGSLPSMAFFLGWVTLLLLIHQRLSNLSPSLTSSHVPSLCLPLSTGYFYLDASRHLDTKPAPNLNPLLPLSSPFT